VGEERRSLPTTTCVCVSVCRGGARPRVLKYPVPRTHRFRSTPPLQKITVPCPVKKEKKSSNRVKAGQKPEQLKERGETERVVRWTTSALSCHSTKLALIKRLSHESMTLHLTTALCLLCPPGYSQKKRVILKHHEAHKQKVLKKASFLFLIHSPVAD
jgi:hypothetical protein